MSWRVPLISPVRARAPRTDLAPASSGGCRSVIGPCPSAPLDEVCSCAASLTERYLQLGRCPNKWVGEYVTVDHAGMDRRVQIVRVRGDHPHRGLTILDHVHGDSTDRRHAGVLERA